MSGFEKIIDLHRTFMRVIGVWPDDSTSYRRKSFKFYFFYFLISCFVIYPQTHKLWLVKNQLDEVIEIFVIALFPVTISCFRLAIVFYKQKDFRFILKMMELDWKVDNNRKLYEMWKNVKVVRFCVRFYLYLSIIGSIEFMFENLYKNNFDKNTERLYYIQSEFFFHNSKTSPIYEIVWFIQCVTSILSISLLIVLDGFFITVVIHICTQIKILRLDIRKLISKSSKNNFNQDIIPIVKRYINLQRFVGSLQAIFSTGFLIYVIISSISISILGYNIIIMFKDFRATLFTNLVAMTYTFINLFLICAMGEKIRVESDKISYELYCISWYKLTLKESKILLIMMSGSSSPFEITAGKFAVLSIEYFTVLVKAAFGYFAMLTTLRHK